MFWKRFEGERLALPFTRARVHRLRITPRLWLRTVRFYPQREEQQRRYEGEKKKKASRVQIHVFLLLLERLNNS